MNDDYISEIGGATKRKAPFFDGITDFSDHSDVVGESIEHKHARTDVQDLHLPLVRDNECELVIDMDELFSKLDSAIQEDEQGFSRVELESPSAQYGTLKFRLMVFLTRYLKNEGTKFSNYDLGMFLRVDPPLGKENETWSYRHVSFMLMMINARDPFSTHSVIQTDVCNFSSRDPCRGWVSSYSFDSLEDLAKAGLFLRDGKSLLCRAQAVCEGAESCPSSGSDAPVVYRGLENQGATCYLNGLLQSLFHIGKFREILYSVEDEGGGIVSALQQVFYDLEANPTKSHAGSSEPLTEAFGWSRAEVGTQQDVQEMNRILIDKLETRLKLFGKDESLKSLFCGKVENYIKCLDIDYTSSRQEDFYDIQLNVIRGQDEIASIEDALGEFLSVETLEGPNAYDAGEFRGKQRAEKGVRFAQLPPILTFQLMRFQFDFESLQMQKLDTKFAFGESLDMTPYSPDGCEYQLFAVLVHSGGVHGGHYYAFIRPEDQWYRFDDTVVERVSSETAIGQNFGGQALSEKISNYLTGPDGPSSRKARHFSAYMLMYVRASEAINLLRPVSLDQVNPDLIPALLARQRSNHDALLISVQVLDTAKCFSRPLRSCHDIPPEWVKTNLTVSPSDSVTTLLDRLEIVTEEACIMMMESPGRFSKLDPSVPLSVGSLYDRLGHDSEPISLLISSNDTKLSAVAFVVLEFDNGSLGFSRVDFDPSALNGTSCWAMSRDGTCVERVQSWEDIENGMVVVIGPVGVEEYFERLRYSSDLTLTVHALERPWMVGGLPLIEGTADPDKDVEMNEVDFRSPLSSFEPEGQRVLFFANDPLLVDTPACQPHWSINDCVDPRGNGLMLHCVFIPPEPPAGTVITSRWNKSKPMLVRLFDDSVTETNCALLYVAPSMTIGGLIDRAKSEFAIPSHHRYRLIEVDLVECDIAKIYRESEDTHVQALLTWGASNILMHCLRLEVDDSFNAHGMLTCIHVERVSERAFGHPFLLTLDLGPGSDSEENIQSRLSQKLRVPVETVKTWRLRESNGVLSMEHPTNPFIQQSSLKREKPLFIRD